MQLDMLLPFSLRILIGESMQLDSFKTQFFYVIYMKVEVYIPDTLSEITLGQYQRYLKLQQDNTNENLLATKMIEIFCGLRKETIMAMKANSIKDITMILTDMFNEKPPLVREFKMGGVSYGFIPKVEDMSFGVY